MKETFGINADISIYNGVHSVFKKQFKILIICNLILIISYLIILLYPPPAYFYHKLDSDPLNYYLKALQISDNGSSDAKYAENDPPFIYVTGPAYLWAPFFSIFPNFDSRLRIIQITNLLFIIIFANLSVLYVASFVIESWHKFIIFYLFTIFSTDRIYQSIALYPSIDPYFTICILGSILLLRLLYLDKICSNKKIITIIILLILISILASSIRFIGALLILPIILYFVINNRLLLSIRILCTSLFILLFLIEIYSNISIVKAYIATGSRYICINNLGHTPEGFIKKAFEWNVNLFLGSIPDKIIPNFRYIFLDILQKSNVVIINQLSLSKIIGILAGIIISIAVCFGMWLNRYRCIIEIILIAAMLPFLMIITNSTSRYLICYQPVFIVFFLTTLSFTKKIERNRYYKLSYLIAIILVISTLYLSLYKIILISSRGKVHQFGKLSMIVEQINDVGAVYERLSNFLNKLSIEETRLINFNNQVRWKAITGHKYYTPDKNLLNIVSKYNTFIVFDYESKSFDTSLGEIHRAITSITSIASVKFTKVYSDQNDFAKATVYRIDGE